MKIFLISMVFMRRFVFTLTLMATLLYAQTGIGRNTHGIRVPSASTLTQGFIYFSGSFETISDGEPLAQDGFTNTATGEKTELTDQAAASGGAITIGYGILDFLELNLSLPLYYEGHITGTKLDGLASGDLEASLKVSLPLDFPIHIGLSGSLFAPTGAKSRGFRPRHSWFIKEDQPSYAYTNGVLALSGNLFISLDIFGILLWNNQIGYLATGEDRDAFLWGTGLELFPNKTVSVIVEASGEARTSQMGKFSNFRKELARFTPGLRLHLPNKLDLIFAADLSFDYLRGNKDIDGIDIIRHDKDNDFSYTIPGTPKIGFTFALTKVIDFSWRDSDQDGVADRLDMCPGSTFGVVVNNRGCPVDQDQDGVLNIVDDCPETPYGVKVDYLGCPLDEDHDGIADFKDQCPGTPLGEAVNETGCLRDSDNDGVDDNNDQCPETSPEDQVNLSGCPIDSDHDGVLNENDKCPETPRGRPVDQEGCPLDFDKDGIPDDIDMCPNSTVGEYVDDKGCPADIDNDGVPDVKDQCPETPEGFTVDQTGCSLDIDQDGVPDDLDKCPKTPTNAPVDTLGCPIDSDQDGIADYLDKCPETLPHILVNGQGCPYNSKLNLESIAKQIHFNGNSDRLLNSSYTALNDVIELLRRYNFNIEVECSASGSNAKAVSVNRAQTIADYFDSKGFDMTRVKTRGTGASAHPGVKLIPTDIQR